MRLVRFVAQGLTAYGILSNDEIIELASDEYPPRSSLRRSHRTADVRLIAPVAPSKIIAVGLNYRDHAHELGMREPENPILFLKPPTTVVGPGEPIVYPAMSRQVDYEAELGVVIKDHIHHIVPEDARYHILGYTCVNDVTARDIQKAEGQWTRAKSFDTFCPVGPWIETDLVPDDLLVESYLNGKRMQSARTSQFVFKVDHLVSFVSQVMTLEPGDLILTGTPAGIGPMKPGDEIEIRVEGIGSLKNHVQSPADRAREP
jgi:2-keto-4-pentenoate hydratase/2-oxohepta-3-ene-1,7-dioic acid hydratase in catechol pathway